MKKILVINPNTTAAMTDSVAQIAAKHAGNNTVIEAVHPEYGPRSIEGHFEEQLAGVATMETVAKHRDDYDAFIIACFGDPAVAACREITDKPVIGIGEAAMHMACFLGHRFSIVTVMPRAIPFMEDLVERVGLSSKCASVRATELSVLEIETDPGRTVTEMINEARIAIDQEGAEVICLGCSGLGPLDQAVQEAVGVPVLDGVTCAVKMAESLLDYGQKTAKVRAFAWPEKKELPGCSPVLQKITK